jgi:hypothetical protein
MLDPDQCPHCDETFEIAALSINVFRMPKMLFVCPNCAMMQKNAIEKERNRVSLRLDELNLSPARFFRRFRERSYPRFSARRTTSEKPLAKPTQD